MIQKKKKLVILTLKEYIDSLNVYQLKADEEELKKVIDKLNLKHRSKVKWEFKNNLDKELREIKYTP